MYTIPSQTVTPMIMALKNLTGHQFEKIMTQVGWSRFLDNMPDIDNPVPIATTDEVAALYKAIYDIAGESVLRQFLRNLGHKFGEKFITTKLYLEFIEKAQVFTLPERLGGVLNLITIGGKRLFGEPRPLTEDAQNYYVTLINCVYCVHLKSKITKPVCEMPEIIYLKMMRGIAGLKDVTCFESSCQACGDPECVLTIPKLTVTTKFIN